MEPSPLTTHAALLWSLSQGDGHGAELAARLRIRTEGAIVLVDGSLYPTLQALIKAGLAHEIRVESRKRIIGLTPKGRELTQKTIAVLERLVGVAP